MKRFALLTIVAAMAVAGSAAVPAPSGVAPQPLLPLFSAYQGGSCPAPAAAMDPAKRTWKHSTAEYNDYNTAAKAATPAAKAQAAAAFIQKYPDSDYLLDAYQMQMSSLAVNPATYPQAVQAAQDLIKSGKADAAHLMIAYVVEAVAEPSQITSNDPDMATKNGILMQAATCGEQLLPTAATPANQAQWEPKLTQALGFAQLNAKDYAGAIATLTKATQQNPKDALSYYWLGIAEVGQPNPDDDSGIFYLARASALQPTTAAFKDYLTKVYTDYHGAADGLDQVVATATSNATPPAGFKVPSKADVENAANMAAYTAELEKAKNTPPPADSFAGIEWRLKRSDYAADTWKQWKGQGIGTDGYITDITAKTADIAVASPTSPADVHVIFATPLGAKRPKVGDKVTFSGQASTFAPNPPDPNQPFLLTLDQGSIKGYSPEAPKAGGGGNR